MKQRKLIRADVLHRMRQEVELGVPVARSMANHLPPASITRPTVAMLINVLVEADKAILFSERELMYSSVLPQWLELEGPAVQEQPYKYRYTGRFPLGRWECEI